MFRMLTIVFYEMEKKFMVGSVKQGSLEFVILSILSGLISTGVTHIAQFRQSWGFPFEYKFKIDTAQAYSGLVQPQEGFSLINLIIDFIVTFCLLATIYFIFKNFKSKLSLFD